MRIGIIGAMQEEIDNLLENMNISEEITIAGSDFYSGKLNDTEVVVVRSGIGKVFAAMTATLLTQNFDVDYVINSGSAGSVSNLSVGDTIVANNIVYFDVDVTAFDYDFGQVPKMPLFYQSDKMLLNAAKVAIDKMNEENYHFGLIGTGDMFIDNLSTLKNIRNKFPEMLCNDMEGAAIAQVAYQYNIPFLVVRTISDSAEEGAGEYFANNISRIGKLAAAYVIKIINNIEKEK